MTQESMPEDNSRDFPAEDSAASEQQIAAEENSAETSSDNSTMSEKQIIASTASKPKSEQDIVRITLIGSQRAVVKTIHKLYRMGFAAVGDWSPLQRGKKTW